MALTDTQKASALFKQSLGKNSSDVSKPFFEEAKDYKPPVYPGQIWAEADEIPATAPVLLDQASSGKVKYWDKLQLVAIPGYPNSFTHADFKDIIPFNQDEAGSYNYGLFQSNNSAIPFGQNDWVVHISAVGESVITFYAGVAGLSLPPKISFYQYIGAKGLTAQSVGIRNPRPSVVFAGVVPTYSELIANDGLTQVGDWLWATAADGSYTFQCFRSKIDLNTVADIAFVEATVGVS